MRKDNEITFILVSEAPLALKNTTTPYAQHSIAIYVLAWGVTGEMGKPVKYILHEVRTWLAHINISLLLFVAGPRTLRSRWLEIPALHGLGNTKVQRIPVCSQLIPLPLSFPTESNLGRFIHLCLTIGHPTSLFHCDLCRRRAVWNGSF